MVIGLLGIASVVVGLIAVVKGRVPRLGIHRRRTGLLVALAGLVLLMIGVAATPEPIPKVVAMSERLVGLEPYVAVDCGAVADRISVKVHSLEAKKDQSGVFLVRRLDLLNALATTAPAGHVPVSFFSQGKELGTVTFSATIGRSTFLEVLWPPGRTWSAAIEVSGKSSPGATVSCVGQSLVVDSSGSFRFQIPTPESSRRTISVSSKRTGETESVKEFTIERMPDVSVVAPPKEVNVPSVLISGTINPAFTVRVEGSGVAVNSTSGLFEKLVSLTQGEKSYSIPIEIRNSTGAVVYGKSFFVSYIGPETAYKRQATTIRYAELEKSADRYAGEVVRYSGKVIQIQESRDVTFMRVAIRKSEYGVWDDIIGVWYSGTTSLLKDDIVTFWGNVIGNYTYESIAGWKVTIPAVQAKYLKKGY